MRRRQVVPVAVVGAEAMLYLRYRAFGAKFHFWLHGLVGATIGLAALTAWRLARHRRTGGAWGAAGAGHLYAAFPDVLFIVAGVLHAWWIDVFGPPCAPVHSIPAPLATMFAAFSAAVVATLAAQAGARRVAIGALGLLAVIGLVALGAQRPVPHQIADVRGGPSLALLCPFARGELAAPPAGAGDASWNPAQGHDRPDAAALLAPTLLAAAALTLAGRPRRGPHHQRGRQPTELAAFLLITAGLVDVALVIPHAQEALLYGGFFAAVAAAEIAAGAALLIRATPPVVSTAALIAAGTTAIYLLFRLVAPPGATSTESVDAVGVATQLLHSSRPPSSSGPSPPGDSETLSLRPAGSTPYEDAS